MRDLTLRLYLAVQGRASALRRQEGQAMVEYALILALVSIVAIVILQALGVQVKSAFSYVKSGLDHAIP